MKVITVKNSEIAGIMGRQEFAENVQYKRSPYCMEEEVDSGKLVYNSLTGEVIFMDASEEERSARYLAEHWYNIPEHMDMYSIGYMVRQAYSTRQIQRRGRQINSYTILTTTSCNARCPYCYERGIRQYSMDTRTAADVAGYIKANSSGKVTLRWFGGEPLCNTKAMDIITQNLEASGVAFRSSITTNGLLFCGIPDESIARWKLKNAQITIDGTHDRYNAVKNYVDQNTDPYDTVMGNIKRLSGLGINVVIRMNVSNENAQNLLLLVDELAERFEGYRGITAYPYPVFDGAGDPPFCPTDEEREILYDNCIQIFNRTVMNGLAPRLKVEAMKPHHCMADSGQSRVVLPDGRLCLCQHYNENEVCGTIYSKKMDRKKEAEWARRTSETEDCRECAQYLVCYRLQKCPNEVRCSPGERRFREAKIRAAMRREYERKMRIENLDI